MVAELCDWVYVMYAGVIVEQGSVEDVFARPGHPYTQALLRVDADGAHRAGGAGVDPRADPVAL